MKFYIKILLIIFCFTIPSVSIAQVSVEGMYRPRTEFRDGYRLLRTSTTEPAFFTGQRTRLKASYQSEKYKLTVSAQDVRVWGDSEQLQDEANVNIHEAYGEVFFTPQLRLQLGRQELIYDNHRLFGNVGWTQRARSHDALRLRFDDDNSKLKIDLGLGFNQERENILGNDFNLNNYKTLTYLWVHKTFYKFELSSMIISDGFQTAPNEIKTRYTYGINAKYKVGKTILGGEAFGQNGDDKNRNNISAYMWAVSVSFPLKPASLNIGFDYLSGGGIDDKNPQRKSFDTLYGTNHKFYGMMDYFLNVPGDTKNGGLQDLYLKTSYSFNEQLALHVDLHYLALTDNIADPAQPSTKLDKALGFEIDTRLAYMFTKEISVQIGHSSLFAHSNLKSLQNRATAKDVQYWSWAMLVISPQFTK